MNDNGNWSRPKGAELEENIAALRQMRAIVWMFVALAVGAVCCAAGWFACAR